MKIYNTTRGILVEHRDVMYQVQCDWDELVNRDDLYQHAESLIAETAVPARTSALEEGELLPPIGSQEVWASGVTYLRSRDARMDESKDGGGDSFYNRVYDAVRPEIFFKAMPYRVVGPGKKLRIRRDSNWNVPEPELTLMISSNGRVVGYTVGNDMSSREIEGENPLYLPQAKTYDGSTAIGPCILVTESPLPEDTGIAMAIEREGETVFLGSISISQMKRTFDELVGFLYRECSFPAGCLLMTGTGIVPPKDFTLQQGDEIRITIDSIGTLVNAVA